MLPPLGRGDSHCGFIPGVQLETGIETNTRFETTGFNLRRGGRRAMNSRSANLTAAFLERALDQLRVEREIRGLL